MPLCNLPSRVGFTRMGQTELVQRSQGLASAMVGRLRAAGIDAYNGVLLTENVFGRVWGKNFQERKTTIIPMYPSFVRSFDG